MPQNNKSVQKSVLNSRSRQVDFEMSGCQTIQIQSAQFGGIAGAGATLTNSKMTVEGCGSTSLQGDVAFANVMETMGAKVDWKDNSISIRGRPPVCSRILASHPVLPIP